MANSPVAMNRRIEIEIEIENPAGGLSGLKPTPAGAGRTGGRTGLAGAKREGRVEAIDGAGSSWR